MRILHVITDLNIGGAEKLMADLLPRMNVKGYEVEICLFNGTDTPLLQQIENAGIKVHKFGQKPNYYSLKHLYKLIKLTKKFDIIHTHNTAPQLFGAIASLFSKAKFCTTEHTTTNHHRVWWFYPIEKWMYNQYDHIICISEAACKNMQLIAGKNVPTNSIIPNGINIQIFKHAIPLDKISLNVNPNNKLLMMVGRYSYQKDQATIIKAMALLPQNIELCLVGYGETHKQLQLLANNLNVEKRVHLLGMRTDVSRLLKTCDIVIQSSHIEGFGIAAVEGMAAGKPVVASDIQGLNQVVNGAGILFPHEDEKTLAEIILHLLKDKNYYDKVTSKCVERANIYDIESMVTSYLEIYKQLVK